MMKKLSYLAFLILSLSLPGGARLGGGGSFSSGGGGSRGGGGGGSFSSGGGGYHPGGGGSYHSGGGGGGDFLGFVFFGLSLPFLIAGVISVMIFSQDFKRRREQEKLVPGVPYAGGLSLKAKTIMTGLIMLGFLANFPIMFLLTISLLVSAFKSGPDGPVPGGPMRPSAQLDALLSNDPNFSVPVFREFAVLLYSQAIQERIGGGFQSSRPYLSPTASQTLEGRSKAAQEVKDVVVGTCQLLRAEVRGESIRLTVKLETNYLESQDGKIQQYIANETWNFERKLGVLTAIPSGVSKLACPSCGYTGEFPASGQCPQCTQSNLKGTFDWVVATIMLDSLEAIPPFTVDGSGPGTPYTPPIVNVELPVRQKEFMARHPEFAWEDFNKQVTAMFLKLQQAWSSRDWSQARPHESDVLFRTHRYWIESYLRAGRINKLENIKVHKLEVSNIVLDAIYESITMRVYATMTDVTVDDKSGQVICGDAKHERPFSEYWTFIRRVSHKTAKGDSLTQCPSCGAPLDRINQAGICEYCETLVTKGDFDWVLSCIEQDEVYNLSI